MSILNRVRTMARRFAALAVGLVLALAGTQAVRADNVVGAWISPTKNNWPLIAIHAALTPDGRVLTYGTKGDGSQTGFFIYDVWNPAQGLAYDPSIGVLGGHVTLNNMTLTDIFCSSQVILPSSGSIFIAGGDTWTGTNTTNTGNNNSNLFRYTDNTLSRDTKSNGQINNMNYERWYSSSTVLANGEVYIQGGNGGSLTPEVRQLDGLFRPLNGADTSTLASLFPRNFLAPDGRIFGYDTNGKMYFVNTAGNGQISFVSQPLPSANAGWTSSAAMYRPGKILQIGGNSNKSVIIDINSGTPVLTQSALMSSVRQWVSATVLADGRVLATGGSAIDNQLNDVNTSAEVWDPNGGTNGTWRVGPSGLRPRLYHSTALLLPDASVLVAGGGAPDPVGAPDKNTHAELYLPSYLFDSTGQLATRPVVNSAPATLQVGQAFQIDVGSMDARRVTIVKSGSVTHSVNMDQRFIELSFTNSSGILSVQAPANLNIAPPGYYLLFVFDQRGVPSVGRIVRINVASGDTTLPGVTITGPTSAATFATTTTPLASLSGTASDNVGVTQVTWSNDRGGSGTATGTTSWSVSNIALLTGANVLTVTARDAAGNLGTDVLTVTYTPPDTTLPVATITGPTSATTFATTTTPLATLSGTASDNVAVTQVTWVNDRGGSGTATGTTSWSVSNIALSTGANVLTVTARDAAGNLGTDVLTVTYTPVESTPPVATITVPTSAATFATATTPLATLSGTASDNVAVTQVTWVNDRGGSGTATGTTTWSVSNVALSSGANVLTVTARDAAGNLGTDVLTVTYTPPPDTTLPVATITGPTSAVTFATTTTPLASLIGTASDNLGVTQVTWSNDRGGSGTATGTTSWSVSNVALSTGANVLTVTARDAAGNLGTDVLTVTYTPPAPSSGLVAAFAFNETTGTTAADASGNANTGTLTNGPVWAAGKNAGALQFDGTNDRVRVADSNSLDLSAGSTFEAWVYSTATPIWGWRTILQKEADAYLLTASGDLDRPVAGGTFNGACCTNVTATAALVANTWTHLAATYDGAQLRMYVNGTQVAAVARTGTYEQNNNPLWIGGNALYGEHFQGRIDDLRIYNRALSAAEIQADMNTAVGPVGNRPPTVTNPGNQSSTVGATVTLPVTASDLDNNPLTYSAAPLPAGLSMNSTTGVISGVPTATGSTAVVISVFDGQATTTANLTWTVSPALPLELDPMPVQVPVQAGTPVTYTATTRNGINTQYKWFFGDGSESLWLSSASVTHTFAGGSLFALSVIAKDDRGIELTRNFTQLAYLPLTAQKPATSSGLALRNQQLWVVNQDNNTVSAFDTATNQKLAEIAVGEAPRAVALSPASEIWVTNKRSGTISVINPTSFALARTINLPVASQPYGLVFAPNGSAAYVALEATGQVVRLDPTSGAQLAAAQVGGTPRHLSITSTGTRLYVSRFITARLPGEETQLVVPDQGGVQHGGEVMAVDTGSMTVVDDIVLRHTDDLDFENSGAGVPNYLGAAVISPDGTSAWVPSKKDNIKRGTLRSGANLNHQNTVRAISSRIDLQTNTETFGSRIDHDNAGLASAAAFEQYGVLLFVALETSREVAVVNAHTHTELFRITVGRAPQALLVSANGQRLYVSNFMDRTVGVFDISRIASEGLFQATPVATLQSVAVERLASTVLTGKQFFYDARDTRVGREGYMSCASCHNDGGQDGRVWDLTGLGEGLRNTAALNGRSGAQGFLHWSANFDEVQDFEGQIRSLAGGTGLMSSTLFNQGTRSQPLGDTKAGLSADLDALAAYLASLDTFARSPQRNADGTLTAQGVAGRAVFQAKNCAQCHGGVPFTNSAAANLQDIGTLKPSSGSRLFATLSGIDTPTLRDVWATAPYLHDGSAATLGDAVRAHNNVTVSDSELTSLVAYLSQIDALEPNPSADVTNPVATITGPTSAATFATTATPLATLSGTASDNVAVTQVTWVNDRGGSGTATGTTSWSVSNIALLTGANVLTVTARDAAGNLGTDVLTVTYTPPDTTLPVATITGPTSATTFATTTTPLATLSGTASDNVAVTQVTWVNDRGGSGTATGTTAWSVTGIALQSGANVLTVTARDAAGNLGTDVLTVTYTPPDTTLPVATITGPTSAATFATATTPLATLSGTASDNVAVTQVTWVNDRGGSGTATGTTTWSVSNVALSSGANVLTVTARDAAGNLGTDVLTVTYTPPPDTTLPVATITGPTSAVTFATTTTPLASLIGTASDNLGVTQVTWSNDRGGSGTATGTTSWSVSNVALSTGANVLTVTARDAAGNLGTDVLTVTYTPPAPSSGLVAAFAFNETTGTTAADASGNANTGTLTNGPVWAAGKNAGALQFDGTNDRVRVADSNSLDLSAGSTFEAWVYSTATPIWGWRTILQKEADAYLLTASGDLDRPVAGGTFNGACCTNVTATAALVANTWTHLAATYDGAQLRMYVNGTQVAAVARTGTYEQNNNPLWIGGNALYGEHFQGRIDDLRIYNRALSAAEIQADMNTAVSPAP